MTIAASAVPAHQRDQDTETGAEQWSCTEKCWTAVPCQTCGNPLPPRGASVPMEMNLPDCCDEARYAAANTRHLWSDETGERA